MATKISRSISLTQSHIKTIQSDLNVLLANLGKPMIRFKTLLQYTVYNTTFIHRLLYTYIHTVHKHRSTATKIACRTVRTKTTYGTQRKILHEYWYKHLLRCDHLWYKYKYWYTRRVAKHVRSKSTASQYRIVYEDPSSIVATRCKPSTIRYD